jgi:hypothetical protein
MSFQSVTINQGYAQNGDSLQSAVRKLSANITGLDGITRNDIPSKRIELRSFVVDGFNTLGDLGAGARYVVGTSTGLMAIADAAGTWFNLDTASEYSVGWFGALGNGVTDDFSAIQDAINAIPTSGGTVRFPVPPAFYSIKSPLVVGDGSAAAPSKKQDVRLIGDGGNGTGSQTGFNNDKGIRIYYSGTAVVACVVQFSGPMSMGMENIVLESAYDAVFGQPNISTTAGLDTIFDISPMTNVYIGSYVTGPGIPDGTIVKSISGNAAVLSNSATATAAGVKVQFVVNEARANIGLSLLHVFRSKIHNVGVKNARIGVRQDAYADAQGVAIGSSDNDFMNIWSENGAIAGGRLGSGAFDIGNGDTGSGFQFDVARNTYTNLVGAVAGDPNATGIVLRYADNLIFRGGMMYSQREPGLGYALAFIPPTGTGREPAFPAEITFQGVPLIGRIYEDPRWKPGSNGNFVGGFWPMHSGDMLDPSNKGRGTLPTSGNFVGVDDRGIFFGWSQFRSWLQDSGGNDVSYDTATTFGRRTQLVQVTSTTTSTPFANYRLPFVALRSRNSKDYPVGTFPLSNAAQFAYDRIIRFQANGTYQNSTASSATQRMQILIGSAQPVLMFDSGAISLPSSSFFGAWHFEGDMTVVASDKVTFSGRLTVGGGGSGGAMASAPAAILMNTIDNVSVDLTIDQFLTAIIQPSSTGLVWNCSRSSVTVL